MTVETYEDAVSEFVDGRRGWKVLERQGVKYAGRAFDYRGGAQALLSLRGLGGQQVPNLWVAQVNIPFAAGPEDSREGELDTCREWIDWAEKALDLPLRLQECKSREDAEAMAAAATSEVLALLVSVFDVRHPHTATRNGVVRYLVEACAPIGKGRWTRGE